MPIVRKPADSGCLQASHEFLELPLVEMPQATSSGAPRA
jgi:hypothetical protein